MFKQNAHYSLAVLTIPNMAGREYFRFNNDNTTQRLATSKSKISLDNVSI